jgi:hypothetical protein
LIERLQKLRRREPLPHVVVRDDERASFAVILVAAGVVEMPMRVQHESNGLRRERRDRGLDLRRERRVFVVDQKDRVFTHRQAHVAAGAGEHVHALSQGSRADLDRVEVLGRQRCGDGRHEGDCDASTKHFQIALWKRVGR